MAKSYIGNPYFGSRRKARIFTSKTAASTKASKVNGEVYKIGPGGSKMFVVKPKGKKFYTK